MARGWLKGNRADAIREDAMYKQMPVASSDSAGDWYATIEEERNGGETGLAGKIGKRSCA
jgi:hypothetical protein